jgi:hypothetical protein
MEKKCKINSTWQTINTVVCKTIEGMLFLVLAGVFFISKIIEWDIGWPSNPNYAAIGVPIVVVVAV